MCVCVYINILHTKPLLRKEIYITKKYIYTYMNIFVSLVALIVILHTKDEHVEPVVAVGWRLVEADEHDGLVEHGLVVNHLSGLELTLRLLGKLSICWLAYDNIFALV